MATIAGISVDIGADLKDLKRGLAEANSKLDDFARNVNKATRKQQTDFESLGSTIKSVFTADLVLKFGEAIVGLGSKVVTTFAEFEKLGALLSNTLGSKTLGALAQSELQQFAKDLPGSLHDATTAFLKLQNSGVNPTIADMRSFADVAANAGKGLDFFAEAVNDATRGEFERLKEFFIDASVKGDKVAFTFKNQTVEVDKNSDAIKKYLVSLGQVDGVMGAAAVQMQTVSGKLSNLSDGFDQLATNIGKSNQGVISSSLDFLIDKVNALADAFVSVEDRGLAKAAKAIKAQFNSLQGDFDKAAASAKASGADIGATLKDLAEQNKAYFSPKLAEAQAKLNKYLEEEDSTLDNLSRNLRTATDEYKVHTATIAKLSGDVQLYQSILNELPNIQEKAVKSTEAVTKAVVDHRNSLEIVNDALEKHYAILGNPDASNTSVKDSTKRIRALEIERDRLQEVIDLRVKGFIPQDLQNLEPVSRGQQPLQGITDTSGIQAISTAALDAQKPIRTLIDHLIEVNETLGPNKLNISQLQAIANNSAIAAEGLGALDAKAQAIAESISSALNTMTASLAEGIGNALSGLDGAMDGAFTAVFSALANLAITVGKIAIGVAVGIEGIKKALESLNPYVAFVAGVALIALGTVARNALSGAASGGGKAPRLATGTNYFPQDGLAYLHQGEAVIPKKFNPYVNSDAMRGGGYPSEIVLRAEGESLVGVIRRYNQGKDRRG